MKKKEKKDASTRETEHLLKSPKNAERLLQALRRSLRGEGKPQSIEELRREFGLDERR